MDRKTVRDAKRKLLGLEEAINDQRRLDDDRKLVVLEQSADDQRRVYDRERRAYRDVRLKRRKVARECRRRRRAAVLGILLIGAGTVGWAVCRQDRRPIADEPVQSQQTGTMQWRPSPDESD